MPAKLGIPAENRNGNNDVLEEIAKHLGAPSDQRNEETEDQAERVRQHVASPQDQGQWRGPAQQGQVIEGHRILRCLGEGGMGVVYLAYHKQAQEYRALKVLHDKLAGNSTAQARFRREVKVLANLKHPNIVRLIGSGEWDGFPYLAMEYLQGTTLAEHLQRQPNQRLDPLAACSIARSIAVALAHIHAARLVHRDVKPGNVMVLDSGDVKLLDLGIVAYQEGLTRTDHTQLGLGPMAIDYTPPERLQGMGGHDVAVDIYSLGATLFELLTGRPPYGFDKYANLTDKSFAIINGRRQRLRERRPELPAALHALVEDMLHDEPTARPASAFAVAARLEEIHQSGCATKDAVTQPAVGSRAKHAFIYSSVLSLLLVGLAGASWLGFDGLTFGSTDTEKQDEIEQVERQTPRDEVNSLLAWLKEQREGGVEVPPSEITAAYVRLAELYESLAEQENALDAWRQARLDDPANLAASEGLARLLVELDRRGEAFVVLDEAISSQAGLAPDPKTRSALIRLHEMRAALYLNQQELARAAGDLKQLAALDPDNPSRHIGLGELYVSLGNLPAALSSFRSAYELDSMLLDAAVPLAVVASRGAAYDEVIGFLEPLTSNEQLPGEPRAILAEAYFHRRQPGDVAKAEQAASAALRFNPDHSLARFIRGALSFERGEYADAHRDFEAVLRVEPSNTEARLMLAESLLALQRGKEAQAEFERLVETLPQDRRVLVGRARALQMLKSPADPATREAATTAALAFGAENSPEEQSTLRRLRGDALMELNRSGEAIHDYEALAQLAPDQIDAWLALARACLSTTESADLTKAERALEQAERLAPDHVEAHVLSGLLAIRGERDADAVAAFEAALKRAPNHIVALRNLIRVHSLASDAEVRDLDRALPLARRLHSLPLPAASRDRQILPWLLNRRARQAASAGNFAAAITEASEAVQLSSDETRSQYAATVVDACSAQAARQLAEQHFAGAEASLGKAQALLATISSSDEAFQKAIERYELIRNQLAQLRVAAQFDPLPKTIRMTKRQAPGEGYQSPQADLGTAFQLRARFAWQGSSHATVIVRDAVHGKNVTVTVGGTGVAVTPIAGNWDTAGLVWGASCGGKMVEAKVRKTSDLYLSVDVKDDFATVSLNGETLTQVFVGKAGRYDQVEVILNNRNMLLDSLQASKRN